jgi:stage IV sporulation protein FB
MDAPTRSNPEPGSRWSIPLVTVAGVTIRMHLTFLALVGLVALAADAAGESVPAAVGWLGALFACVVAHEFAHAMVARSKGIAVHEIDLLPIGGVSRLERIPDDWRDESAIAAAGPLASLAIAGLAFVLAITAGQPLLPIAMWEGPLLVRLAWMNLLLAGFNLVPAFPLDGGRVFRALLERDRSRVDATRQAVRISRGLAMGMIAVGVVFNLWLIVIGLFVMFAGKAEEAAVLIHATLGPVPALELAVPCPASLRSDASAAEASAIAHVHPQPAYPVIDPAGRILGLVDLGALLGSPPDTLVRSLASGGTVDVAGSLEEVAEKIAGGPVAVTRSGAVVGVITAEVLNGYLRQRLLEASPVARTAGLPPPPPPHPPRSSPSDA